MTNPMPWRTRLQTALMVVGGLFVAMWVLEIIDMALVGALDDLGISAWQFSDLPSLLTAPFVHFGIGHLVANTVPGLALGIIIALDGVRRWLLVTAIPALTSGLAAFFLTPPPAIIAGFSGVVFGYLTYLLARGAFSRNLGQIVVAVVVFLLYGSILWGVLPSGPGVSWQGHLGGALGGLLVAFLAHRSPQPPRTTVI